MMENRKKLYLNEIKRNINCDSKEKNKLINFLEKSIDSLIDERENMTIDDLILELGEPQKVAKELEETISEDKQRKYIKKAINVKRVVAVAVSALLIMFAIWLIAMFVDAHETNVGSYFEETLEIITEEYDVSEVNK